MKIVISNTLSIPLYEQIKNEIKAHIMGSGGKEEEKLPSVRVLAKDLGISILTVKKAYDELEAEGFIVTRQGLGSFIRPKNEELAREEALKKMEEYFLEAVSVGKRYEIDLSEMKDILAFIYEEEKNR